MNTESTPIRVLVVDDSALVRAVLRRIIIADKQLDVVGAAQDGAEAMRLAKRLKPDVICLDFNMPVMDGLEFTKTLMATQPTPILVVSGAVEERGNNENTFKLLKAGAIDVFRKPENGFLPDSPGARELRSRIKMVAQVKITQRHRRRAESTNQAIRSTVQVSQEKPKALILGCSTGGPQALTQILPKLPLDTPPILCVQHISTGFITSMVTWLDAQCSLKVQVAEHGQHIRAGNVYIAPENYHMALVSDDEIGLSRNAPFPVQFTPSVDVLFYSAAKQLGSRAVGVLLSGMGIDGSRGLLEMCQSGARTIAQSEESCIVFGMPGAAIALGAAQEVLPSDKISDRLIAVTHGRCHDRR